MRTVQELFDLSGQAALVTGGAGLLGTAISESLAEAGARVAIASRNLDHCQETARKTRPRPIWGLQLDIGSEASNRDVVDEVAERFGRLDILVNCAYTGPRPEIDVATADEFDEALHLSITAYFVASQQAARHMRAGARALSSRSPACMASSEVTPRSTSEPAEALPRPTMQAREDWSI